MNRPDGWGGPPFAGAQQWGPGAPHPGQPYPGQYPPPGGPRPPYPPHPAPWPGAGQHFAPPPPARRSGSGRRPLVLVLAGLVVLALLGGGGLLMSGAIGARDQAAPVVPVSAPAANPGPAVPDAPAVEPSPAGSNVTIALPPTIDGRQQLDSPFAKALVDPMREQLAATASADAVVGLYGNPDQSPAFLVAASTTTYDTEQLLTGMAAGMQESAPGNVAFVDQPAGPLGGTMRCAETDGMSMCLWGADGTFGMNMVYNQNLADAAATTLRVREAVEKRSA
jgi:hypothetical protein